MFAEKGQVTECSLKYSSDGKFRGFGFIGYKTTKEAESAVQHFNKAYYNACRLQVQLARDFKLNAKLDKKRKSSKSEIEQDKKVEKKKKKLLFEPGELPDDDMNYRDFLSVQRTLPWKNDLADVTEKKEDNHDEDNDEDEKKDTMEPVDESGRLFIRNLPYCCTEDELQKLFETYGAVSETHISIDPFLKKPRGFAFVTFLFPADAACAIDALDGTDFQGRLLHICPAEPQPDAAVDLDGLTFKQKREVQRKQQANNKQTWNTLFLGSDAVASSIAAKYGTSKGHVLDAHSKDSLSVRLALGETELVEATRKYLQSNGVSLQAFSKLDVPRSKTVFIVKNLPAGTELDDLEPLFNGCTRLLLPPQGLTALVEYSHAAEARTAFRKKAFTKFKQQPLYLEWAPEEVFVEKTQERDTKAAKKSPQIICTKILVRNVPFEAKAKEVEQLFKVFGELKYVRLPKKMTGTHRGFAFVDFVSEQDAKRAFEALSTSTHLYGRRLVLEWSTDATKSTS